MIEGRPRESLVLYDNPIEVAAGMDPNQMNPHRKSFGSKCTTGFIERQARRCHFCKYWSHFSLCMQAWRKHRCLRWKIDRFALKMSSTRFCRRESGSSRASTSSSTWATSPLQESTSPGFVKCSIRSFSSAKLASRVSAPCATSCSASASTRSFARWHSTSPSAGCFCSGFATKWTWPMQHTRCSISPLSHLPCANNCRQSMAKKLCRRRSKIWKMTSKRT